MPERGSDGLGFRPWRVAWGDALYGEGGFYRRAEGPRGHFETSANAPGGVVELLAEALVVLAERHGCTQLVDLGAGRGELLTALASSTARAIGRRSDDARAGLGLTGVDVVRRPPGLPDRVRWVESPGGADLPPELGDLDQVLVVAHEWLDVVPCDLLELDSEGVLRVVEVDPSGRERLGGEAAGEQLDWCARWWPVSALEPGARVEVGLARDAAWADLVSRVRSGVLVAVDYGHLAADRPPQGSLAAHRAGRLVPPVPDGSCDLTADLAWDSILAAAAAAASTGAAAGATAGAADSAAQAAGAVLMQRRVKSDAPLHQSGPDGRGARLTTQREMLTELGVDAGRPARPDDDVRHGTRDGDGDDRDRHGTREDRDGDGDDRDHYGTREDGDGDDSRATREVRDGDGPAAYLRQLQRSAAAATLLDRGGLGGLGWLVQEVATGQADPPPARVGP